MTTEVPYTFKDFQSDQEVRWCPGCGDYVILRAIQKTLPLLDKKKEDFVFISGIGCSSRFPYYMDTYGMHSIHGRAPSIATGVKLANPDLSVWVITGDGDALAIGGNHFIHAIRRNIDLNIILFNNKIYGLTKGQFSPTSDMGQRTKSSPYGNIQAPFHVGELAIGAQSRFYARVPDNEPKYMTQIFVEAERHTGTSVVEVLQNCVIFNDGAFDKYTAKDVRADELLYLEHGKPMIFGKDRNKGIVMSDSGLEVAIIGENDVTVEDIMVHDAKTANPMVHFMLTHLHNPMPVGVIRSVDDTPLSEMQIDQIEQQKANSPYKNVDDLLFAGEVYSFDE